MTPPMLTAALALAATGWRVHPLAGKAPRLSNGVNGATTDPDTIRAWWTRWPDANMGARVPAGIVVVDVDNVAALEATHGPIPPTLTVWSGRGDGARHLYLRRPPGQLVGKLAGGIDIKRDNAYMVMPPSRHPDTGATYRWERRPVADPPDWLCRLLLASTVEARPFSPVLSGAGEPLVRYVSRLTGGNRNAGLFWASCRAAEQRLGPQVLTQLVRAAVAVGLPEIEARRTVASAARKTGAAV